MKNLCNKTRPLEKPYEIWQTSDGSWEWRVLKKWQNPENEEKNPYARWFCAVKSPMTYDSYEYGDVYVSEITQNAKCVFVDSVSMKAREELIRKTLESTFGRDNVWDTEELKRDFTVLGFVAPFCVVIRKTDNVKGSLEFTDVPRFYFDFHSIEIKSENTCPDCGKRLKLGETCNCGQ